MPKRTDIHKIMIIGSGPIVIGQACEFDYSGTQACKALREEGYEVVLINSNPATIMTDPETADRTYVEPITPEAVIKIIEKERPDALLPTLGGQTALNTALEVAATGALEKYGVELIGAKVDVIKRAEDRILFKEAMVDAKVECLKSKLVSTLEEAEAVAEEIGFPIIIRPSFTLGGTGGGTAYNLEELKRITYGGLKASLNHTVLLEESILGWKEFELEVMRDRKDNVVIVCSIENVDPMGIHTGDSVTVAPVQTLTDREYQLMRDAAIRVMRVIGVETGGSNVQFAVNPQNGRMVVIEMNPRVSRSSALASKATGFPIAKIAAKLAVGYTLDEIPNDITRETPASFEPTLDYCVVKFPRFAFEKFAGAEAILGVSMKSVGETMAIGANFKEAYQKALRGLEIGVDGYDLKLEAKVANIEDIEGELKKHRADRHFLIKRALKMGIPPDRVAELTKFDPWFIDQFMQIIEKEHEILAQPKDRPLDNDLLKSAKRIGFSDRQIAALRGDASEHALREQRKAAGIKPVYRLVDTCAAEFEAYTPYFYSAYQTMDQSRVTDRKKVIILSSGPNRIGQGIEFDYCCVHTVKAARELGYEAIMVNSNPETVSTDYDTSDKLYFEPLTFEDVMNIYENEKPLGIVVQMGGQTPLNLAVPLMKAGCNILGTSPDSIDIAEDRKRCRELLNQLGLRQPESDTVTSVQEAAVAARKIGYPVMIRPSYVLGGRAMMVAYGDHELGPFVEAAFMASPGFPVLIDRYLERATEVDVDCLCDGTDVYIGGVMQHIEVAGIHSGDSACATPPHTLPEPIIAQIKDACRKMALALNVKGLMNVQMAVKDGEIYVIEINPRASRTVPYVSKATGVQLAKMAAKISLGMTLKELGLAERDGAVPWCAVKEAVLPFNRFPGVDPILGPEMKSTGEVMGIDRTFELAYWKSQIAAGQKLPKEGGVFLSARDSDKPWMVEVGKKLAAMKFKIIATEGTAHALEEAGIHSAVVHKLVEGQSPNVLDLMKAGEVKMVINTPSSLVARADEIKIRTEAISRGIPIITTQDGASATVHAIEEVIDKDWTVCALQDYHA
ncbi:MAG TPA: carbamoyl-phosphate synthase large subunit [Kiritimatiellia bacterium]|nr:carbamoyl-phosphate synthase large subunit [Kiritimatiellia bacterium]HMO98782.1 carbamoyl-phosphate synthase large subunit [Kiritimatiellia bacterium]HMP97675.1 carbamoyl-phosphate synthase large subunit [Kiritimatiellia bacterium]